MPQLEEIAEWGDVNARHLLKHVKRKDPFSLYTDKELLVEHRAVWTEETVAVAVRLAHVEQLQTYESSTVKTHEIPL